ncbi:MAG: phosphate uptake regulator PhoU [Promethearchaeota archaeon]
MSSDIDSDTSKIKGRLLELQNMVTSALVKAMEAFEDLDSEIAESVLLTSDEVELLHHSIEEKVFATVSEYRPKDYTLRQLIAYLNTSSALHQVGRYSTKIADIVNLSEGQDHFKELVSLPYLADLAKSALEISVRAVINEDLSEIDELEKLEALSDNEAAEMFQEIADYLNRRRDISEMAMYYIIVGRYCERAADKAIVIAEAASYMITGERKKFGLAYKGEEASLLD